ncbi:O-antigen ligase family protein [Aureimonas sp. SA4125]|uniref:O-antigen ligase family protein n=1 Tax=Aureimonas sp. SA4125 TaxID=2826993 RepID=UPI001CC7D320|nr:O-antigen ligase family protein [Aureimonas sp. SA4125]
MYANLVWLSAMLAIAPLFINDWIGAVSPLLFLFFGGVIVLNNTPKAASIIIQNKFLLIFPLLAFVSIIWSNYPMLSLRHSVQLLMTFTVAIIVLERIDARGFMRVLFTAAAAGAIMSLLFGKVRGDGIAIGVFGSKNAYAAVLAIGVISSYAVTFDPRRGALWRASGPILFLISFKGMLSAQSAGTILTLVPALALFSGLAVVGKLSRSARGATLLLGIGVVLTAVLFYIGWGDALLGEVLAAAGKDATLTGRTDLWIVAKQFIATNPVLGVGYQAFWVQGFPPAERIWDYFLIRSRSGFNFHNTYYEISVQLGLIGGILAFATMTFALCLSLFTALRYPSPPQFFIASLMAFMYLKSFGEVGVFFEFRGWTIILIATIIYSLRPLKGDGVRPKAIPPSRRHDIEPSRFRPS